MYFVSIVFVQISSITSEWQLSFSDNFDESSHLDENKWVIYNPEFVRVIDGNLALSADRRIVERSKTNKITNVDARYAEFYGGNNFKSYY